MGHPKLARLSALCNAFLFCCHRIDKRAKRKRPILGEDFVANNQRSIEAFHAPSLIMSSSIWPPLGRIPRILVVGAFLCGLANVLVMYHYGDQLRNYPLHWRILLPTQQPPIPSPIPVPETSLLPNATFSACLLVKDDNDILNEWIAYHYFVLNLRTLILATDPTSTQSPAELLQRWRSLTDMKIIEWTDPDYMPTEFVQKGVFPSEYNLTQEEFGNVPMTEHAMLLISIHRYRQRVFLAKCMKTLKVQGHSWMMHIDTDEYVTVSKLLRNMKHEGLTIPNTDQPGAVLNVLQQTVRNTSDLVHYPCIGMLRVLFGSVESQPQEVHANVPTGFDAVRFETFRWRYHGHPHDKKLRKFPKMILDISAIPEADFPDIACSVHRPIEQYCQRRRQLHYVRFRNTPIALNHYLGSWERYSARNDIRRSRDVYDLKAKQDCCKDDYARKWLNGFVKQVGSDKASQLLQDYLSE